MTDLRGYRYDDQCSVQIHMPIFVDYIFLAMWHVLYIGVFQALCVVCEILKFLHLIYLSKRGV